MYNALIKLYVNGPHSSPEQTFYFFFEMFKSETFPIHKYMYITTCKNYYILFKIRQYIKQ